MKARFILAPILALAVLGCASPSGVPAPAPSPSVVIHPAPKEPGLIANDLLPEFKRGLVLPPAPGSDLQKSDEAELRERQAKRTAEDCARANTEVRVTLGNLFGPPYGPLAANEVEPLADFFSQIRNDADFYIQALKKEFPRQRPFLYLKELRPCVPMEVTGAYPSGHATISRLYAKILADLYPARSKAFTDRADTVGADRVLAGVHHPTDVRAGKQLGDAIYRKLRKSPAYRTRFAEAKAAVVAAHAAPRIELRFEHRPIVRTNDVEKATAVENGEKNWSILIHLKPSAAKRLARITRTQTGKPLEIVVDDMVISAPLIRTEITNGNMMINESFTRDEAEDFVKRLSPRESL